MRLLDELAESLHAARGKSGVRHVINSLDLRRQFDMPFTPSAWRKLEIALRCPLPPLRRTEQEWVFPAPPGPPFEKWEFPTGWSTVKDLAEYLVGQFPEWDRTKTVTNSDWREAQIFAGVRQVLVEAGSLSKVEVIRSARLQADLGLE